MTARSMFITGVVLVVAAAVLQLVAGALLGQQPSEFLANIPTRSLSVLSWLSLSCQVFGLALVAVAIGVRCIGDSLS